MGSVQSQEVANQPGVEQWLPRLQAAAGQRTYTGTFVVTAADRLSSARIWHVSEGSQQMERVDALSGVPRSVLRRNDEVLTLLPQSRMAISEKRQSLRQFPDWLGQADASLAQHYVLRPVGADRVAGWEADVARQCTQTNSMYTGRRHGTIWDTRTFHEFLFHAAFTTHPQCFNFGMLTG